MTTMRQRRLATRRPAIHSRSAIPPGQRNARAVDKRPVAMRPPIDIDFAIKGIIVTASTVVGAIASFQKRAEWHMGIAPVLVGFAGEVLAIIGLWRQLLGTLGRDPPSKSIQEEPQLPLSSAPRAVRRSA